MGRRTFSGDTGLCQAGLCHDFTFTTWIVMDLGCLLDIYFICISMKIEGRHNVSLFRSSCHFKPLILNLLWPPEEPSRPELFQVKVKGRTVGRARSLMASHSWFCLWFPGTPDQSASLKLPLYATLLPTHDYFWPTPSICTHNPFILRGWAAFQICNTMVLESAAGSATPDLFYALSPLQTCLCPSSPAHWAISASETFSLPAFLSQ